MSNDLFNGDYLRVLTPITTDGVIPLMKNGEQVYKEMHLPYGAKSRLEAKNLYRQPHLRHIIEVVKNGGVKVAQRRRVVNRKTISDTAAALATAAGTNKLELDQKNQEIEQLKAQLEAMKKAAATLQPTPDLLDVANKDVPQNLTEAANASAKPGSTKK